MYMIIWEITDWFITTACHFKFSSLSVDESLNTPLSQSLVTDEKSALNHLGVSSCIFSGMSAISCKLYRTDWEPGRGAGELGMSVPCTTWHSLGHERTQAMVCRGRGGVMSRCHDVTSPRGVDISLCPGCPGPDDVMHPVYTRTVTVHSSVTNHNHSPSVVTQHGVLLLSCKVSTWSRSETAMAATVGEWGRPYLHSQLSNLSWIRKGSGGYE